jgi:hypothetical protein
VKVIAKLNYANLDESEVTSPISIADWLRDFYPIAARNPACIRGRCEAGEVMYIPSGKCETFNQADRKDGGIWLLTYPSPSPSPKILFLVHSYSKSLDF